MNLTHQVQIQDKAVYILLNDNFFGNGINTSLLPLTELVVNSRLGSLALEISRIW